MSKDEDRLATGIHAAAAAVICSKTATDKEIALAGEILKRDPKRSLPRELESPIEAFNRQMDTAIESCNRSSGESTRAARRARLASDLEREGLVLIDCCTLAELLERKLAGDLEAPAAAPLLFPATVDGVTSCAATIFGTHEGEPVVGVSSIAGVTSAEDLGAELCSSELANSGSIDVDPGVND
jgi:hypothetical protein